VKLLFHRLFWRLDAYLGGEPFAPSAEVALREHLKSCAECRGYYDEGLALMRATRGRARLPGAGELERLARRAGHLNVEPRPNLRPLLALAPVAAAVLLVIALWPSAAVVGEVASIGSRASVGGEAVLAGAELHEGDVVAAVEGSAVLRLEGGRDVTLAEGTVLTVSEGGAFVALEGGQARFSVEPGRGPFAVRAGETRVDVKGTVFSVARKGRADVTVAVERGRVEVAGKKGAVTLDAGQRTSVGRDGAPRAPSALEVGDRDELLRLGEELERSLNKVRSKVRRLFR
jgi:ferric-dicitrate binding protein FerR (iron transport regulator)